MKKQHNIVFSTFILPASTNHLLWLNPVTFILKILVYDCSIEYRIDFSLIYFNLVYILHKKASFHEYCVAMKYRLIYILFCFERRSVFNIVPYIT